MIAAAVALPIVAVDDLREMGYGEWEGRRFVEVREQYAEHYARWIDDPEYPCPGGESHRDLLVRMQRALTHIEASSNGARQRVVVVSHGGVMMALWAHVTGAWDDAHVPPNCGIILIEHHSKGYMAPRVIGDGASDKFTGG